MVKREIWFMQKKIISFRAVRSPVYLYWWKDYQSFRVSQQVWPTCLWNRAFWYYTCCWGALGTDYSLLCQLSALPCHSHLLHIFFASLQNLTLDLSPWPVDIGHWSSRKPTIDPNTLTKNRLQKGKIVAITTFLNFIPKGSGLRRFPRPITKSML